MRLADKRFAGDNATPEGRYTIIRKIPSSLYYKALLIDYPNAEDRVEFSQARRRGDLPASARIGGFIEIHGAGGRNYDWTNGCIAVSNSDMVDIWLMTARNTPIEILP